MNYKNKISAFSAVRFLILTFSVLATLYPLIYMIAVSFSKDIYVLRGEVSLIPKGFTLDNYKRVFANSGLINSFENSILYTFFGTILSLFMTALAAYALSKKRIVFSKFFTIMIIITMYFNGGMIPTYMVVRNLKMIDTIWAVLLPSAMSTYNLLVMRSFFDNFPTEVEEAAQIDGVNDLQLFFKIVLPSSRPVLASVGLFYAVAKWNAFFEPFLYLTNEKLFPLQLVLRAILSAGATNVNQDTLVAVASLRYACVIISIIPIVAVYPFVQKYFVKGVMLGAVKG